MFKPYSYKKDNQYLSRKVARTYSLPLYRNLPFRFQIFKSLISLVLVIAGVVLLATKVLFPVVVTYAHTDEYTPVISPVPDASNSRLVTRDEDQAFTFKELSGGFIHGVDYVEQDGIVYPEFLEEKVRDRGQIPNVFYVTVPKLEIVSAKVEVNSNNLDPVEALGHYNGSCLPDEACNTFIFGHSTFRGSVNRYEGGDYTTIFSRLDELEYGDEFFITYDGKEYRYIVELTKVERPENVDPLSEPLPKSLGRHDNTVELFTCTPPGTTKYRLSVVGKLVK